MRATFPPATLHRAALCLVPVLLLAACASPQQEPAGNEQPRPVPELNLNLPTERAAGCECEPKPELDRTFLVRGLDALALEDYVEAVQYFQRYARIEKTGLAAWESRLAIAYASILPRSPFFDPEGAAERYRALVSEREALGAPHPRVLVLLPALESLSVAQRRVEELEASNGVLRENLQKREQALRRLRELTLGEPGAPR